MAVLPFGAPVFIGHFALGFAAKRAVPRVSLAILFTAAQLADMIWPVLVALGVEQVRIDPGNTAFTPLDFVSYPYSHSLVLLAVWGVLLAVVYRGATGRRGAIAILIGLVISHWVLDVATHRADMPVYPGGARLGLGLWNSVPATLVIESAMFVAGVWIYARGTRGRDGIGRWGFPGLVALLSVAYLGAAFGPPPPTVRALWITSIIGAAVGTLLSWWIDRHREATGA